MKRNLERRLEELEARLMPHQARVIVFMPIGSDGQMINITRFECRETGDEWHRHDDETLDDFIARVDTVAHEVAKRHGNPMVILLTPDCNEVASHET